jgi:hypothetical protein
MGIQVKKKHPRCMKSVIWGDGENIEIGRNSGYSFVLLYPSPPSPPLLSYT